MPAYSASAPGKIILLGEHAVVYSRPAIAVPVTDVHVKATLTPTPRAKAGKIHLRAGEIGLDADLDQLPEGHPLAYTLRAIFQAVEVPFPPAFDLKISSTIPVASGLGSGAAVSVAVIRVVSGFLGRLLPDEAVNALAYDVEKLHHGTPSGIDNTVITYGKPIYYVKNQPIECFSVPMPFTLVIGDTGVHSRTRDVVGAVRRVWEEKTAEYDLLFDRIAQLANDARHTIENGKPDLLGPLMNENHQLLQRIGVSSPELDRLVDTATQAGALGAKLSGAGWGGNMLALVTPENAETVARALCAAGARQAIISRVRKT